MISGFVVAAVVLYRRGRLVALEENPAVVTLLLVAGFLLGVVLQHLMGWLSGQGRWLPRPVEDLRATVSLTAAVVLAVMVCDQYFLRTPVLGWHAIRLGLGRLGPQQFLAAVVGFDFGSRS